MAPETKQKLTLTVDADTVEAAKKLGLNISELTERVLRGYTYDPEGAATGANLEEYKGLLRTMDTLLTRYGKSIVVGDWWDERMGDSDRVYYSGRGGCYVERDVDDDHVDHESVEFEAVTFDRPAEILKRFLTAIESARSSRREESASMLLAKRMVEALNEQELARGDERTQPSRKRGGKR